MEDEAYEVYDSLAEAREDADIEDDDEVTGKDEAFLKGYESVDEEEEGEKKKEDDNEETEDDYEF